MQNRLTGTHQTWCDDLLLALRLREVPGARIGEVLAEVQSHLAETGEDPLEAFGTPGRYADEVAGALELPASRRWLAAVGARDVVVTVVMGLGGFVLADGLWSLGAGEQALFGLPGWAAVVAGVLLLGGMVLRLVTSVGEQADPVVDPRTGADMVPFAPWRVAVLVAVPVLMLAGMLVGGFLTR